MISKVIPNTHFFALMHIFYLAKHTIWHYPAWACDGSKSKVLSWYQSCWTWNPKIKNSLEFESLARLLYTRLYQLILLPLTLNSCYILPFPTSFGVFFSIILWAESIGKKFKDVIKMKYFYVFFVWDNLLWNVCHCISVIEKTCHTIHTKLRPNNVQIVQ